ncbi:MAG: peptidylprolyl isomerase [Candidatus Latescibacteria bacterium]|nr:peptidylprolyl isomerase [Candidatus Latescibacterota bacterium]
MRRFLANLPAQLKPVGTGEEAVRDLLQSLVDSQIMVLEATAKGYDRDPQVLDRLQWVLHDRLKKQVFQDEVARRVRVTEEEVRRTYTEQHWDKKHLPAHILSATEAQAWEVVEALKKGRNFSELARERSLKDGERGGELGRYFARDEVVPELAAAVLDLPVGGFTNPIRTRDGYEVVKVLALQPVSFEAVQGKIERGLRRQQAFRQYDLLMDTLETKYQVVYHPQGIAALIKMGKPSGGTPAAVPDLPLDLPVVSLGGDRVISLAAVQRVLKGSYADSLSVVGALRGYLVEDSLLALVVADRRLDQTEEFLAFKKERFTELLVGYLRKKEVMDQAEVSEDEVRQQYEKDQSKYRVQGLAGLTEILVSTEQQAKELLAQVRAGADMEALARQHSLRPDAGQNGGHIHLSQGEEEPWGSLYAQVQKAQTGELIGPLEVEGKFGIFRVESSDSSHALPLDKIKDLIRFKIKKSKEKVAFEAYIAGLRARYQDQVRWHDQRIAAVHLAETQ